MPNGPDSYWNAMCSETGILNKDTNPQHMVRHMVEIPCHDTSRKALELYDAYPGRTMKFGVSQAHTYQWLHALASLGRANRRLTADCPTAMAFDKGDVRTYAVHNYSDADITVKFSDGFTMTASRQTHHRHRQESRPCRGPRHTRRARSPRLSCLL